jgi:hypothetical protein
VSAPVNADAACLVAMLLHCDFQAALVVVTVLQETLQIERQCFMLRQNPVSGRRAFNQRSVW